MSVTDEIKARIDIVDFISRYVTLQRSGRTYKARCPFHEERTPSFVVWPDRGTWHCFGACGEGGDVFSFLMKKENLDFRDALRILAQEAGVELEPERRDDGQQEREKLYEVNAVAALYFRNQLHRHPDAAPARRYLQGRGIHADVAEQFQLGFALDGWDNLRNHLLAQGYDEALQHKAGLLKFNEARNSYYDAFRNRLIIPITDRHGRVIGFGGRVLDDSVPKYLNTTDTPIFHKSSVIYGFDKAYRAIRQEDRAVIVEGYMDVIAAHQFGFANVVACMGTAVTEEQLQQLRRFTSNFVLALDADTAGQQATLRALNQARQALQTVAKPVVTPGGRVRLEARLGANLRIATLPTGRDPDDIVRQDPDLWRDLINSAQPLVDYYIEMSASQRDLESAQGKAETVAEIVPLIAELHDEIERQHYIQRLSRLVQIDEQIIAHRVASTSQALSQTARRPNKVRQPVVRSQPEPPKEPPSVSQPPMDPMLQESGIPLERYLLAVLLEDPNLLVWLAEKATELELRPLRSHDLQDMEHREIFVGLQRFIAGDELWDMESFQETLGPHLHSRLADLMIRAANLPEREPNDTQEALLKAMIRLRRERLREDLAAMQFLLQDAQRVNDREAILEYSGAINAIRRERQHLDRVLARIQRVPYGMHRLDQGVQIA
ncbi:MAG: DNA primase [Caldilineae bacterium]|nr:MAG: DNA primase [Caldilineae bacterium]